MNKQAFAGQLLSWYDQSARPLPWRYTRDPYAIWVSEIMLQQTRAETVIPYWERFLCYFPSVQALAAAPEEAVLKAWEGLGYYSRARNLRRCAQVIVSQHDGLFPQDIDQLRELPGIGEYTAGAVASIAFGRAVPAVDGNVERVLSRLYGVRENISTPSVRRQIRAFAAALVPAKRPGDFNQAMMELGARVCQPAPRCQNCPVSGLCDAFETGDADALPIKDRKAPPAVLARGIALVTWEGRVLVYQREERLLQGLWCFPDFDHATTPETMQRALARHGIQARYTASLGNARHVFTHRVWEMTLLHFTATHGACPPGWRWVTPEALAQLPLPTAMKAAREMAAALLSSAPSDL